MKIKLLTRLFCALLSVLMMVCVIPAITVSAAEEEKVPVEDLVSIEYPDAEARLAAMGAPYFTTADGSYSLYCDERLGDVAYRNNKTGEILFTNPWSTSEDSDDTNNVRSQILLKYVNNKINDDENAIVLTSYKDAALKGQLSVSPIKNGVRVEYAIGERAARILLPQLIERADFEEKILKPMYENATRAEYQRFKNYYTEIFYASLMEDGNVNQAEGIASSQDYKIAKEKYIDIYAFDQSTGENRRRELALLIMENCPDYTFEEMDNDHAFVEYEEESISPPIFKMALEYTLDETGLVVSLPGNGLRYDESAYRVTSLTILPYMGASLSTNEGYTFIPDGSGALLNLKDEIPANSTRVYGEDYAAINVSDARSQIMHMPIFGQVETVVTQGDDTTPATTTQRGFLGIIESGESLASITADHLLTQENYAHVYPTFLTRPYEKVGSEKNPWLIYAGRRYVEDYKIRYIILSDDKKAEDAGLTSYYECSWMGMACAYRDYLDQTQEGFKRLTDETVKSSIPLYIETFGCLDSIEKVMSIPVTVSVPLTSFENIATMYDYLAGEGVTNVNFKLTGYANGGMYSEMPYKLKWEKSVGGKSGFEELTAYAAEKGFSLYPDFDFVYTTQSDGGSKVNMKKNAARTIENRYTAKRTHTATRVSLVSYYQMVMAPETYSKFYEKLGEKYAKYENATGISLASFGNALNSDFDEEKISLREESKAYVIEALAYFKQNYDVMLDGANAFTWNYADHILNVPLDSSRYNYEYKNIPFMGVVLHGYVEFAGSPLNMEGNLRYAMLKAMENGASVYFVLSYANTELLKEDILLSQNYSVRYDIWQSRLVEIYAELNAVLADVQTKLIVGHTSLTGSRIPDADELLEDIAKDAKDQIAQIEQAIEDKHKQEVAELRQARIAATEAAGKINGLTNYVTLLNQERGSVSTTSYKYLYNTWKDLLIEQEAGEILEETLVRFNQYFKDSVSYRIVGMRNNIKVAAEYFIAAKQGYEHLVRVNAIDSMQQTALAGVEEALVAYEALMTIYDGRTATVPSWENVSTVEELAAAVVYDTTNPVVEAPTDADVLYEFILGETPISYPGMGAEAFYESFVNLLIAQDLYDPADPTASPVNVEALLAELAPADNNNGGDDANGGENGDTLLDSAQTTVVNPKYEIDADIILVTYGEVGQKFGDAGTKSLILNFNNYAVTTTLENGSTYTIEAYGYVVIYS
ncbi:MAG: hypothetical protein E7585_00990 [Ruminococcaceae bacterium]|nr:hypothetical protein [Oscillospiraceae bacterium]